MPKLSKVAKSRVEAADFAKLRLPRALALSPDGKLLAFTLSWCDFEKKKYFANLHVLDIERNEVHQWTFGEHSDRAPVWSRDGSRLAFLRSEKGEDRIYAISRAGGEPQLLFKARGSFSAAKWALEDGALIVKFRPADPDPDAEKAVAEGKEPTDKAPAVRKVKRLFYRLDGDGYFPESRWHLFRLNLAEKSLTPLTEGRADVEAFAVSHDGAQVAYVMNTHRDPDRHLLHAGIFTLDLQSGKRRMLPVPPGEKDALAFSPNGKYLVYVGHHNLRDAWGVEPIHPYLVDLRSGRQRDLTPGFDRQTNDTTIGDLGFGLGAPALLWSADSRHVFVQVTDEGDTHLARVGLRGGSVERVWKDRGQVAVASGGGRSLALVHVDFTRLGDIHVCTDNTARRLTFRPAVLFNRGYVASHELGKVREVRFRSGDGTRLHGWLVTPPDFDAMRKYPAILEVHGGPRTQYGRIFFHEMQYLAAQGFVVFLTNPRGSQGYGRDFADAITRAWGTVDYGDIMAAANWLEAQPFVSRKRIGITGGSYGGYMTAYAVGRTRRFRAAVAQRGVMNLVTMQGTSDIGWDVEHELGGFYWDNPEGYAVMSPITYAHDVRTPLLILHNEGDLRCSIEQAEQLFVTLKILGRAPVEFWRFPEEPHGLSRTGRPDRRVIRLEGIAGWFKKWMR